MRAFFCAIARIFTALGVLAACFMAVFAVVSSWRVPIHQINLWRLEAHFDGVIASHPLGSTLLLSVKDFGNLFRGASNGCDYFVGEFRSTTHPKEEVRRNYSGLFVGSFDKTERVPLEVYFLNEKEFSDTFQWYAWQETVSEFLETSVARDDIYVVFVMQTDFPPDGDIRCQ